MFYTLPIKVSQYVDQFTGRTWLLPKILEWYDQKKYERMLLITGDPGTGKSMVAAWLAGSGPLPEDPAPDSAVPDHLLYNGMPPSQQLALLRSQVRAVHFCQAEGGSAQPIDFAQNTADQLTGMVPGFKDEIEALLLQRISFKSEIHVDHAEPGVRITGQSIDKIILKDMDDQTRFNRTVREPLINLFNKGFSEPILIIVDSLDEGLSYANDPKIHNLLAQLLDLPYQANVRILATTRPDYRVLKAFPQVSRLDLVDQAPADADDVTSFAFAHLPASLDDQQRNNLAQKVGEESKGIFLYGRLVVDELATSLESGAQPETFVFPPGLTGFYNLFLERELGKNIDLWRQTYKPVLGVVSIAQGDGLKGPQVGNITGQDAEKILLACLQYLDGKYPTGPFRVFHRSFADFLLQSEDNELYLIDASQMHALIADYYYTKRPSKWDDYAQAYIPIHLEGASHLEDEQERHNQAQRLVQLVLDPMFQKRYRKKFNDEAGMKHIILSAIRAAANDTHDDSLDLLLQSVRQFQTHRHERLKPGPVFAMAEQGAPEKAISQLVAFPLEAQWQRAAALVLAWLASEKAPEEAASVLKRMEAQFDRSPLEIKLADRLRAALQNEPAVVEPLPAAPPREAMDLILMRISGQTLGEELIPNVMSGYDLHPDPQVAEILGKLMSSESDPVDPPLDNLPVFLAQQDGPFLVAYAVKNPEEGFQLFQKYLDLHSANPYLYYRNASLWLLIDFVLRHPHPDWTLRALKALFLVAFNTEGMAYEKALELILLANQASAGQTAARQALNARQGRALESVNKLEETRYQSDIWGVHKRRLAALAQAYSLLQDEQETVEALLSKAIELPRGFAGFTYSALLNLAEAIRVCGLENSLPIAEILEQARASAQNIQDSIFCARATAHVNAMLHHWWPLPDNLDLEEVVPKFSHQPNAAEFCALHIVGEDFQYRENTPDKIPLQPVLLYGQTLRQLSEAFRLPLVDFMAANPDLEDSPDTDLAHGTLVNVPDPNFAPLLASRLSAEVAVADWLYPDQKRALIQLLVLPSVHNRTEIDTIMARLFLAAAPDDLELLDRLVPLAQQVYAQFPDFAEPDDFQTISRGLIDR